MTTPVITAPPADPESGPAPRTAARWFRPGFAGVLVLAALVDLWDVGANGDANAFYAAAVQASTRNPVAWLFAAVDAPGFITVDKPPADNWWMGLWANLVGFSPWSMLVPQAVLGIATVALLVLTVRRWSGPGAALVAGVVLALTPVAVIMFRFDDPDPMLTFLLVAAAYALVRAVDAAARRAGTGWLVACGLLIGLGFLAKMGVAMLVVPAFALVHLVAADVAWRRRIGQLVGGLVGIVVGAGWFLALVDLWPASSRPWIGGSTDNSLLQLAVGYNGLSRIVGRSGGGPGGGPGRGGPPGGFGGFGGQAGLGRMFSAEFGGQIAWLLPAALLVLVALLWASRRAPATDRLRAAALLWGGWLVVSGAVFSFMEGIVHSYYTIVMAPPIAALVAIGAREAWVRRGDATTRVLLAVGVLGTAAWSAVLLWRSPTFLPWLPGTVLVAGVLAALLVVVPTVLARRAGLVAALVLGLVATLGGASAYAVDTVVTPHGGTEASAGPAVRDQRGSRFAAAMRTTRPGQAGRGGPAAGGFPGGFGGFGGRGAADPQVVALLRGAGTQWAAATPTTMAAAGLELASDTSVMGLGGFSGSDPTPTLAQFQGDVSSHLVRYYVTPTATGAGGRGFGGFGGRGAALAPIQSWVQAHYTGRQVGADTVYDLAAAAH
ncbi:glycosyltransferase family 39 protein [Actinomycetospora sp. TBRC 11914]|uniref:glycosyltransferase family 39 protein n=1 Tax=Actinomycetospora sp. TBRC 11914 TaxID=2729387 RepID=UPI00145F3101|nr:glycosyltransferase family 39 protein [Actinomycetospora sp. TBRC 11914]NMO91104.1 glycosyltransferase family 39 protein [Actinomycetospora sp. TBRC 11914]